MTRLRIPVTSKEQLRHIHAAEDELAKAGVTFDTGSDLDDVPEGKVTARLWELDWSLVGAEVVEGGASAITQTGVGGSMDANRAFIQSSADTHVPTQNLPKEG